MTHAMKTLFIRSILRSPWLYVSFAVALITSPLTFLWFLVLGTVAVAVGLAMKQGTLLAVGIGLILGAAPYPILGLLR